MNRDPFYQHILQRLEGQLNPDVFEKAAGDLLRDAYPGLALVVGGADGGMDGAVGDGEGEPYPVIVTTGADAIGNLTANIRAYKASGRLRNKAVFATSRRLTTRRRANLFERALELGVTLVNIHDQEDIAARLYRNSVWCRELLGLAGDPLALSKLARTARIYSHLPLVGRDETLAWLRGLTSHAVLVGQPGSGKTFVLQRLVDDEEYGLFVVDGDRGRIASAIRDLEPFVLIVDDAHVNQDLLLDLFHMGRELDASFRILATSWPRHAARVAELLGAGNGAVHELPLLTRDEVVEVVEEAGISRPRQLVADIVTQAEGRPGLAVTLVHACKTNSIQAVISGKAVTDQIIGALGNPAGQRVKQILAGHALGGETGLPFEEVADTLGIPVVDAQNILTELAAGGVILETNSGLSVRPPPFRHALVGDVFFSGALSLPASTLLKLLDGAPAGDAAETLVGARIRGANVPIQLVTELAARTGLWKDLAWSGPDAVNWVLDKHPDRIVEIALPALAFMPERAIPRLLDVAVGDDRELRAHPTHPLRIIEDWVRETPDEEEAFSRRQSLWNAVVGWLAAGSCRTTASRCIPIVFELEFNYGESDPGAGMKIFITHGPLSRSFYDRLFQLWPDALAQFAVKEVADWKPLLDTAENWYFSRVGSEDPTLRNRVSSHGRQMLVDLAYRASEHPGVRQRIRQALHFRGEHERVTPDDQFEVLFPPNALSSLVSSRSEFPARHQLVRSLAHSWASSLTNDVVTARLNFIAREQSRAGLDRHSLHRHFVWALAEEVEEPGSIASLLMGDGADPNTVAPFLATAAVRAQEGWSLVTAVALESSDYCFAGAQVALESRNTPRPLVERALQLVTRWPQLAWEVCLTDRTPTDVVVALLEHEDRSVSREAVRALHGKYERGELDDGLRERWEDAFTQHVRYQDAWMVSSILPRNPGLAERWLRAALQDERADFYLYDQRHEDALAIAANALSFEKRKQLLRELPPKGAFSPVVAALVGEDLELYRRLLENDLPGRIHLAPLNGAPDEEWCRRAQLALSNGYAPKAIANVLVSQPAEWTGSEVVYWSARIAALTPLLASDFQPLHEVAAIARAAYLERRTHAEASEREEAIYGRRLRRR